MIEFKATHLAPIKLGHAGETEAVRVAFSLAPFEEAFPGGRPALLVRRKGDAQAYPSPLTVEGDTAYWTVTAADTAAAGFGQCELQWYAGDTLAKSDKFDFLVVQALEAGAEPPDAPSKRWFDAIQSQIGDLNDLTTKAKENLVAAINEAAKTGSGGAGSIDMQVSGGYIQYSTDGGTTWENLIAVSDLKGEPGEDGAPGNPGEDGKPGADGYSPVAKVEETADGAKITITDKTGTTEATVKNGKDGSDGAGMTEAQAMALNNLFKIVAYTQAPAEAYAAFKQAFGVSGGDTPIEPPTGDTFSVTLNLQNVVSSNTATRTESGKSYTTTLTVTDGYTLQSVTVTMGGVDITASVYGDGGIIIPNVNADVIITASASADILYELADTPRSIEGLNEETGISFGAETANGYVQGFTICCAFQGFTVANKTILTMDSGAAIKIGSNNYVDDSKAGTIRFTVLNNTVTVTAQLSNAGDYRAVITKAAKSVKTAIIHVLGANGEMATTEDTGTYGTFSNPAIAGNLITGDTADTINAIVIYKDVLGDDKIKTFLQGGDI